MSCKRPAAPPAPSIPRHALSFAVLIVLTLLTYINSLHGEFVFDDLQVGQQNSEIMNVKTFRDALNAGWFGVGQSHLLFGTYALNFYWTGTDTFSFHDLNLVLHVLIVLLFYGIVLAVLRQD